LDALTEFEQPNSQGVSLGGALEPAAPDERPGNPVDGGLRQPGPGREFA
jgi:hypothetical protein